MSTFVHRPSKCTHKHSHHATIHWPQPVLAFQQSTDFNGIDWLSKQWFVSIVLSISPSLSFSLSQILLIFFFTQKTYKMRRNKQVAITIPKIIESFFLRTFIRCIRLFIIGKRSARKVHRFTLLEPIIDKISMVFNSSLAKVVIRVWIALNVVLWFNKLSRVLDATFNCSSIKTSELQ